MLIVYGSRFLGGDSYVRIHFYYHYLANKILTHLCNIFTNLNMTDMETGYKVFKLKCIKSIKIRENSFGVEPEITMKLARKNYKFYEVGISYNGRSYEEGKNNNKGCTLEQFTASLNIIFSINITVYNDNLFDNTFCLVIIAKG